MKTIAITANSYNYLLKFRTEIASYLMRSGYNVIFISPLDKETLQIQSNIKHFPLNFKKSGYNFISLLRSTFALIRILKNNNADILINNTIKPFLLFSWLRYYPGLNVKICSILTGLGFVFTHDSFKHKMLRFILRPFYFFSCNANSVIFLHNPDDHFLLTNKKFMKGSQQCSITYGSGVDLKRFSFKPLCNENVFLFCARLLKDKGLVEFVTAATRIKKEYSDTRFLIIGAYDDNPAAVSDKYLDYYIEHEIIEYYGYVDDVRPFLEECSCFVLPSYREGCPRSTIEALSVGRAIITTDVPGCRETVTHGENGFLVKKKSIDQLVDAMITIITQPEMLEKFSLKSRALAIEKFNIEVVNRKFLDHISLL